MKYETELMNTKSKPWEFPFDKLVTFFTFIILISQEKRCKRSNLPNVKKVIYFFEKYKIMTRSNVKKLFKLSFHGMPLCKILFL